MPGWIRLYRSLMDDFEWYQDSKVLHLYIHLLLKVNHEDKNVNGKRVKRGQTITSLKALSEETGLSVQEIRTAMGKLRATHNITSTPTNKYTLITVEKYDTWQKLSTGSNTHINTHINNQSTTNNNDNKLNKVVVSSETTNFSSRFSDTDWEKLDSRYEDLDSLVDYLDDTVIDPSKVQKPLKYACSIADRHNWPRKGKNKCDWAKSI